jgi:hypothetical protein
MTTKNNFNEAIEKAYSEGSRYLLDLTINSFGNSNDVGLMTFGDNELDHMDAMLDALLGNEAHDVNSNLISDQYRIAENFVKKYS